MMYILLGYEVIDKKKNRDFLTALDNILDEYEWHLLTAGLYMITMDSKEEWDELETKLSAIATGFPLSIRYFLSPIIKSRRYNGWLPDKWWGELRDMVGSD